MKSRLLIIFFIIFAFSILAYKVVNRNFLPGKKDISSAPANGTTEIDLGDNVRMHFVPISNGCFKMGQADENMPIKVFDDTGNFQFSGYEIWDDSPERNVAIRSDFYLGKHEVTQEQYQKIMGKNSSAFKSEDGFFFAYDASLQPVDNVRWYDAISFCNNLSANQGLEPCYTNSAGSSIIEVGDNVFCNWEANGYRLPTEAEWEYCCKAGTNTRFSWGNAEDESTAKQNAWYQKNADQESWSVPHAERHGPQPVGQLEPNPWGICDMHGNVDEWCWDWHDKENNTRGGRDPLGPETGSDRIICGGNWIDGTYRQKSNTIYVNKPFLTSNGFGFRVLRAY